MGACEGRIEDDSPDHNDAPISRIEDWKIGSESDLDSSDTDSETSDPATHHRPRRKNPSSTNHTSVTLATTLVAECRIKDVSPASRPPDSNISDSSSSHQFYESHSDPNSLPRRAQPPLSSHLHATSSLKTLQLSNPSSGIEHEPMLNIASPAAIMEHTEGAKLAAETRSARARTITSSLRLRDSSSPLSPVDCPACGLGVRQVSLDNGNSSAGYCGCDQQMKDSQHLGEILLAIDDPLLDELLQNDHGLSFSHTHNHHLRHPSHALTSSHLANHLHLSHGTIESSPSHSRSSSSLISGVPSPLPPSAPPSSDKFHSTPMTTSSTMGSLVPTPSLGNNTGSTISESNSNSSQTGSYSLQHVPSTSQLEVSKLGHDVHIETRTMSVSMMTIEENQTTRHQQTMSMSRNVTNETVKVDGGATIQSPDLSRRSPSTTPSITQTSVLQKPPNPSHNSSMLRDDPCNKVPSSSREDLTEVHRHRQGESGKGERDVVDNHLAITEYVERTENKHCSGERNGESKRNQDHSPALLMSPPCPPPRADYLENPAFKRCSPLETALFARGEHEKVKNRWDEGNAALVKLRGSTYMTDSIKVVAQPQAFRTLGTVVVQTQERLAHAAARLPSLRAFLRDQSAHYPYFFIVNWQLPGDTAYSVISVAGRTLQRGKDPIFDGLWDRFVCGDASFRSDRIKFLCVMEDAPWFVNFAVNKLAGNKPALIGRKLECTHHTGRNYVEVGIDVSSSTIASSLNSIIYSNAQSLALSLGFMLEGRDASELPERLITFSRFLHVAPKAIDKAYADDELLELPSEDKGVKYRRRYALALQRGDDPTSVSPPGPHQ